MIFFETISVYIFVLSALLCNSFIFKTHATPMHELDFGESDEEIIDGVSLDTLDDDIMEFQTVGRNLTAEEEVLANEARNEIAKVVENNLVRLFAVIASQGQKFGRQEDEPDEEDVVAATPAPNVLPQVAQILGAIFSNNLNLTRIVDQTFGLVPNVVRMQLMGLVKLLTGQDLSAASTTPQPEPPLREKVTTIKTVVTTATLEPTLTEMSVSEAMDAIIINASKTFTASDVNNVTSTPKPKYRIKNRTTKATTENSVSIEISNSILEDDELEKLEKDLRATAKIYEPYVKDKQARFFVGPFRTILDSVNFNSSEILRAVPNIFKGARRAFVLLESLGVVRDIVDDLEADDE